ncbi:hypothetical protein JHK86_001312 [Glycine max]|nr:hypothetical protein JHK86_001312 [Glycine max]
MNAIFCYHRGANVEVRIARIFNTYGPRMCLGDGRVVSNFVAQALRKEPLTVYGDGKQTRSFQYVSDLIISTERGAFSNGLPLTKFDREMDAASINSVPFLSHPNLRVFVGGSIRVFDLHDKEPSTIIYESLELDMPLVRLGWNKKDSRYMTAIIMDSAKVVALDIFFPMLPMVELQRH